MYLPECEEEVVSAVIFEKKMTGQCSGWKDGKWLHGKWAGNVKRLMFTGWDTQHRRTAKTG